MGRHPRGRLLFQNYAQLPGRATALPAIRTQNMENSHIRASLLARGQVQGVGFRYRARYAAQSLELTGWVQNEDDGSVTLEVQGSPDKFMTLFALIQKSDYIQITGIRQKDLPPDPWERGFSVRGY